LQFHNFCFVDINDDEGKDKDDNKDYKADDNNDDNNINDNDDKADADDDDADDENDDIDEAVTDSNNINVLSCPDDGGEDDVPVTAIVMMRFAWRWDRSGGGGGTAGGGPEWSSLHFCIKPPGRDCCR
jgi:hypothetical protein